MLQKGINILKEKRNLLVWPLLWHLHWEWDLEPKSWAKPFHFLSSCCWYWPDCCSYWVLGRGKKTRVNKQFIYMKQDIGIHNVQLTNIWRHQTKQRERERKIFKWNQSPLYINPISFRVFLHKYQIHVWIGPYIWCAYTNSIKISDNIFI